MMVESAPSAGSLNDVLVDRDARLIGRSNKIRFFPLVADHARGSTIVDPDGRTYVDLTAGWAVANTGYSHPRVVQAIKEQAERLSFASYVTVTHPAAIDLAQKLLDVTPANGPRKVAFGLSGSDANEGVSKLLPIATKRPKVISFYGAMHGMSGSSAGLSGLPAVARFGSSPHVTRVPFPYPYRPTFGDAASCGRDVVRYIEDYIFPNVSPPEMTGGILVEPIQSDAGVIVPPDDFLPSLRALCDKYEMCLIVDEVKVGVGRTGRMWCCELTQTVPDILIAAKAIASGLPLSATVAPPEILDAAIGAHVFTTAAAPIPCAAACATLDVIREERLAEHAAVLGAYLLERLRGMQQTHTLIGDVRGRGLIIGVELVRDRVSKQPAAMETAKLVLRCYQRGLLVHTVSAFANVVEITPPLVLTREEADHALDLFERALTDVEQNRVSDEAVAPYLAH